VWREQVRLCAFCLPSHTHTLTQTGHVPCFAHSLEICTVEGKHACKPRRLAAHLLGFDFLDRRTSLSSQRDTNFQHWVQCLQPRLIPPTQVVEDFQKLLSSSSSFFLLMSLQSRSCCW
jgi:hypothetical protein